MSLTRPLPAPPDWMGDALCAQIGGDLFFPDDGQTTAPARAVCAACPVTKECLNYALDNHERHGVWGGVDTMGRRKLAKKRAAA